MKRTVFAALVGVMVGAALTGCSKTLENGAAASAEKDSQLVIDLQGLPMAFKAELQTDSEKKVSQVDVAIYDASGVLEWTKHYNDSRSSRYTVTGLVAGSKTIAVAANCTIASMPTTLAAFKALASDLKDNSRSNFVMVGTGEGVAATNPEPVSVKLARLVAKFSVEGNIKTQWEGDAPGSFDITDIYLCNVATASNFSFDGTAGPAVNPRTSKELTIVPAYKDLTVASKVSWTAGQPYNGGVTFYGYPNSTQTYTCIMIKALYDGRECYYAIELDQTIKNNTLYKIGDITITCEGMPGPEEKFEKIKVIYNVEVVDWDFNEVYPAIEF